MQEYFTTEDFVKHIECLTIALEAMLFDKNGNEIFEGGGGKLYVT